VSRYHNHDLELRMRYLNLIPDCHIKELMYEAYLEALNSPDPSSQNGALLYHVPSKTVVARACNTFPIGVFQNEERWNDRTWKYPLVDHAEASVLLTAFRAGVFEDLKIEDMAMICPWAACTSCAKHIIGFGLKSVITHKQGMVYNHGPWVADVEIAKKMFAETDVAYELYDGQVGDVTIRRNGKPFSPDKQTDVEIGNTLS